MMLKFIPLTALALGFSGLSSGVALADHHGGSPHAGGDHRAVAYEHHASPAVVRDHRDFHGGGAVVRDHRDFRGSGGGVREGREWRGRDRVIVHNGGYYGYRRPIYVHRPIIRERYYDYYRRPALIVENYNSLAGYYWVAGSWQWNGYEWSWQPGHYEPDPNYAGSYYDSGY